MQNSTPTLPTPQPAAWPYNRRHELPKGHDRDLYSTARWLQCYGNAGQYIGQHPNSRSDVVPAFRPVANRASRRAAGQRGDGYGDYFEPRTSPRARRPYDPMTPRTTVHERQRRRAPGRVAAIMRGQKLTAEEVASGRYFLANEEQANLLRDLMRAL